MLLLLPLPWSVAVTHLSFFLSCRLLLLRPSPATCGHATVCNKNGSPAQERGSMMAGSMTILMDLCGSSVLHPPLSMDWSPRPLLSAESGVLGVPEMNPIWLDCMPCCPHCHGSIVVSRDTGGGVDAPARVVYDLHGHWYLLIRKMYKCMAPSGAFRGDWYRGNQTQVSPSLPNGIWHQMSR